MDGDDPFRRGLELARRGDCELALACLRRSLALTGERSETLRLMGKVHLRLGEFSRARDCWLRALALDPDDAGSAACLAVLAAFRKTRRRAAALAATLGAALLLVGVFYVRVGRHGVHPAAEPGHVSAPPAAPSAEEARTGARAVVPAAAPAAAVQPPATAQPLSDEDFARLYRAALEFALRGEIAEARARFETLAGEEHAGRRLAGNVHFWLGRCLAQLRETEAALKEFRRVIDRYPESPKRGHALLDAGRCWLRLGRRDLAEEAFRELLAGDYEPALQELARKFVQR